MLATILSILGLLSLIYSKKINKEEKSSFYFWLGISFFVFSSFVTLYPVFFQSFFKG